MEGGGLPQKLQVHVSASPLMTRSQQMTTGHFTGPSPHLPGFVVTLLHWVKPLQGEEAARRLEHRQLEDICDPTDWQGHGSQREPPPCPTRRKCRSQGHLVPLPDLLCVLWETSQHRCCPSSQPGPRAPGTYAGGIWVVAVGSHHPHRVLRLQVGELTGGKE